jgi:peptidoglycan/xylan/chitin deacetylase (PgdA/CDA1 family)
MTIRTHLKQALGAIGYYRARLSSQPYPGVAVLGYHGIRDDRASMRFGELQVSAARFASHLETLRGLDCTFIAFDDWGAIADGRQPLPPRAVMVTFDDGYRSVYADALHLLEKYEVPAIVFVCTDPVERQVRFWFDALAERHGESAVEQAKALTYSEWRDLVDRSEMQVAPEDPHAPMSIDEVREMAAHPLIAIGAHTATHPILARGDVDAQREEIRRSRESLEQWLGRRVAAFAYPNGRPGMDFTEATEREVETAGFTHGFALQSGFADPRVARYSHPRFLMLDTVEPAELAHRLSVAWPAAHTVTQ